MRSSAGCRSSAGISGWHVPFFVGTHHRLRTYHSHQLTQRTNRGLRVGAATVMVRYGMAGYGYGMVWYVVRYFFCMVLGWCGTVWSGM